MHLRENILGYTGLGMNRSRDVQSQETVGGLLDGFRGRLERMVAIRLDKRLAGRIEAADVVQDTFAEALRRWPGRTDELDDYLWVRLLTGQRLTQVYRFHLGAAQRDAGLEQPGIPDASSAAMASAFLDRGPSPSAVAMGREGIDRLRAALDEMSVTDREVLAMRHFEGLANNEIAAILDLSEQAASVRYVRAVRRLRDVLGTSDS